MPGVFGSRASSSRQASSRRRPSQQARSDTRFYTLPPGILPINQIRRSRWRGARPSFAWRRHGKQQALIEFNSKIQHVVVIYMENRTPENLFGGFWNTTNSVTGNTFGTDLNVVAPESVGQGLSPLYANLLEAPFDPDHSHIPGFTTDVTGSWTVTPGCANNAKCTKPAYSSLSYVPTPAPNSTSEVANYITLIQKWAFANAVLQSNEGPSFPSHQEAIAGQSGGLADSSIGPYGQAENPQPTPPPYGPTPEPDDAAISGGSCETSPNTVSQTVNMNSPYPGTEQQFYEAYNCNQYPTIFDVLANTQTKPAYDVWQYIAINDSIIWSGPMAVKSLYTAYLDGVQSINGHTLNTEPFAADPNAYNFVANLTPNAVPSPARPFASLTYITPCVAESDHPNFSGHSDGPQWLAFVLNAIGESPYWQNTAVVVTWDDWGGFLR